MDTAFSDGVTLMHDGVDIIGLRHFGRRYPVAGSLLGIFATRDKASRETKLLRAYTLAFMARQEAASTLADGAKGEIIPLTIQDITAVFFSLQELGCGTLDTNTTFGRFIWKTSLISAGRFATQDIPKEVWLALREVAPTRLRNRWHGAIPFAGAEGGIQAVKSFTLARPPLTHIFMIRPDKPVTFSLPQDFTPGEAKRLAAFIRTLPFGASQSPAGEPTPTHPKLFPAYRKAV